MGRRVEVAVAAALLVALLMTFLPSIYLSGLLFPIEGMPRGAQYLAAIIPLTYDLRVVRGIVLKGIGFIFGAVVFTLSVLRFRKQLE